VLVLVDVVKELKLEHVLALLVILVVPNVLLSLVHCLKHDHVANKLSTPNGESLEHGVLVLQSVVWELKLEHVLALLVILVVPNVLVLRLRHELVGWKLLILYGKILETGVLVLQDAVWELNQEHVLAMLVMLVVPHALVQQVNHELVEWKLLTPNGELMDNGVLVLQDVARELRQDHVLALLAIHVVPHVVALRVK